MGLDRVLRQVHLLPDLAQRERPPEQAQDSRLAFGQRAEGEITRECLTVIRFSSPSSPSSLDI